LAATGGIHVSLQQSGTPLIEKRYGCACQVLNKLCEGAVMTEEQVLKWIFIPVGVLFLLLGFGLALLVPLLVLIFYVGKGL